MNAQLRISLAALLLLSACGHEVASDEANTRDGQYNAVTCEDAQRWEDTPYVAIHQWRTSGGTDTFGSTELDWHGCAGTVKSSSSRLVDGATRDYEWQRVVGLLFRPDAPQPEDTVPVYEWRTTTTDPSRYDAFLGATETAPNITRGPLMGYAYDCSKKLSAEETDYLVKTRKTSVYAQDAAGSLFSTYHVDRSTTSACSFFVIDQDKFQALPPGRCVEHADCPATQQCDVRGINLTTGEIGYCSDACRSDNDCTTDAPVCDPYRRTCVMPIDRYEGTEALRATEASYIDADGMLAWAAPNQLRREDHNDGVGPQPLVEGTRVNLVPAGGATAWTISGATVGDAVDGPSGQLDARRIDFESDAGSMTNPGAKTDGVYYATSAWARTGYSRKSAFEFFSHDMATESAAERAIQATEHWQRFDVLSRGEALGAGSVGIRPVEGAIDPGDDLWVYGYQEEEGLFPSSYIRRIDANLERRRAADEVNFEIPEGVDGFSVHFWPNFSTDEMLPNQQITLLQNGTLRFVLLRHVNETYLAATSSATASANYKTKFKAPRGQHLRLEVRRSGSGISFAIHGGDRPFGENSYGVGTITGTWKVGGDNREYFGRVSEPLPLHTPDAAQCEDSTACPIFTECTISTQSYYNTGTTEFPTSCLASCYGNDDCASTEVCQGGFCRAGTPEAIPALTYTPPPAPPEEAPAGPEPLIDFRAVGTFSRASVATMFDPATGVMTEYPAGSDIQAGLRPGLRLDYTLEGAGENLLSHPDDLASTDWNVKVGISPTFDVVSGPDASKGNIADLVSFDNVNRYYAQEPELLIGGPVIQSDTNYSHSVFVKAKSVDGAEVRAPYGRDKGGTGRFGTLSASTLRWSRGAASFNSASGTVTLRAGGMYSVDNADDFYAVHAQLEKSPITTSYMPSGTRAADTLDVPSWVNPGGRLNGARSYLDIETDGGNGDGTRILLGFDAGTYLSMGGGYGGGIFVKIDGQTFAHAKFLFPQRGDKLRVVMDPSRGELLVLRDGIVAAAGYSDPWEWPEDATMTIGRLYNGGSPFHGEISNVYEMEPVSSLRADATPLVHLGQEGSFTRTSEATTFDAATGELRVYAKNALRRGPNGGYLLEGQSTNLAQNPEAFEEWTTGATITADAARAPDGSLTADRVMAVNGPNANTAQVWQPYTTNGVSYYSMSTFARGESGDRVHAYINGLGAKVLEPQPGDWTRLSFTRTDVVPTAIVRNFGVGLADGTANPVPAGQSALFWGAQFEALPFSSSYISDASGTRAFDNLYVSGTTFRDRIAGKRVYFDFRPNWVPGTLGAGIHKWLWYNASSYLRVKELSGSIYRAEWYDGTTIHNGTSFTWSAGDTLRILFDHSFGELAVSVNDRLVTRDVFGGAEWAAVTTTIGSGPGEYDFFGEISDIYEAPALLDYADTAATFSRPTEAWWFDESSQSLTWFGANTRRILANGSIVMEGPKTNELRYSHQISGGGWDKSANAAYAEDGATGLSETSPLSASDVVDVGTGETVTQSILNAYVPQSTQMVFSTIAAGDGSDVPFGLRHTTAGSSHDSQHTAADGWFQVIDGGYNATDTLNHTTVGYLGAAGATSALLVQHSQLEEGRYPTSPILTAANIDGATRGEEKLSYPGVPAEMQSGVWEVTVTPEHADTEVITNKYIFFRDAGHYLALVGNGGTVRLRVGGVNYNRDVSWSRGRPLTIRVDNINGIVAYSGFDTGNGTVDFGATDIGWPDGTLWVGGDGLNNTRYFDGIISPPRAVLPSTL